MDQGSRRFLTCEPIGCFLHGSDLQRKRHISSYGCEEIATQRETDDREPITTFACPFHIWSGVC